jgi:hypothetical protein
MKDLQRIVDRFLGQANLIKKDAIEKIDLFDTSFLVKLNFLLHLILCLIEYRLYSLRSRGLWALEVKHIDSFKLAAKLWWGLTSLEIWVDYANGKRFGTSRVADNQEGNAIIDADHSSEQVFHKCGIKGYLFTWWCESLYVLFLLFF